jgi:antitoxin MazE
MQMKVKLAKWGNSAAVRLPKAALEATGLKPGAELKVLIDGHDLVLRAVSTAPRITIGEMVAEMKRLGPENHPEIVDWGPDRGAEIIDDEYSRGSIRAPGGGPGVGRSGNHPRARTTRRKTRGRAHRS